ncbi:MAG: aspartate aminotransferase family protein [Theionarchaea archaeon]|nr:aspartate aminotransferase family protein [Theionarchaea archaeon]MBU7000408.1 aspartate aminotransferase family protein [Theionarchaea archaeon]MBU7021250.1 aspartate aminotransferase family protein [Theionarchaea archaeon]MBU7035307.1 aspartate aminotransferase family protein [Theionarchaea archaeon]MBU7039742.1 aspartate aminotransferase family protein [Theionarchaea archaeon]
MIDQYRKTHSRSWKFHQRAAKVLPGGDTRSVTYFDPYPCFIESGSGCRIYDVDGNEYLDFLNNYTALILGHAHPQVVARVTHQIKKGTVYPAPIEVQTVLAEVLTRRISSCKKIRFCNSGTEANIQALRAARAFTKRKKVVKVYRGYHGSFDFDDSVDITFNDLEKAEGIIRENKDEIACVIIEPILGKGMIPATREFLCGLREVTAQYDILLILDEVVTFRLDLGGVQSVYKVEPDITVLGKVIGGGFPVGAFGGREDILMQFSPQEDGFIPHSGTFNGNPVTMAAGLETLKILDGPAIKRLNDMGEHLKKDLNTLLEGKACISGMGSLLHFQAAETPASSAEEFETQDRDFFRNLHILTLLNGIYMAPRGLFNVSLPMGDTELGQFTGCIEGIIDDIAP